MEKKSVKYELMLIIRSDLEEKIVSNLLDKINKLIVSGGGKVLSQDSWGKKVFPRPVKKLREGLYFLFTFTLPPLGLSNLDKKVKIEEQVIRYLITKRS
jgi:small subunit ribosomal protein S6